MKLTSLLALAGLSSAVPSLSKREIGDAIVQNSCDEPVYIQVVGPKSVISGVQEYSSGATYSQQYIGQGISIQISNSSTLYPQTVFAYTLDEGSIVATFTSLNDVGGNPFSGHEVQLESIDSSCAEITWPDGISPNGGSGTKTCPVSVDLKLTLCG